MLFSPCDQSLPTLLAGGNVKVTWMFVAVNASRAKRASVRRDKQRSLTVCRPTYHQRSPGRSRATRELASKYEGICRVLYILSSAMDARGDLDTLAGRITKQVWPVD